MVRQESIIIMSSVTLAELVELDRRANNLHRPVPKS